MTSKELVITPDTKIGDLLAAYPHLQDTLIEAAPVFTKLKNPVLRRTIARVTTVRQASIVGKISLNELVRTLRKAAGQGSEDLSYETSKQHPSAEKPQWTVNSTVAVEYDAREDLENGIHPVNKVVKETSSLNKGEVYILVTGFVPAPLLDLLADRGFDSYSEEKGGIYRTFFRKK